MLALDEYEQTLCPMCGMPADECADPLMPTRWTASVDVCHTQLMRNIAVSDYRKDHAKERPERLDALVTHITPNPPPGGRQ